MDIYNFVINYTNIHMENHSSYDNKSLKDLCEFFYCMRHKYSERHFNHQPGKPSKWTMLVYFHNTNIKM